MRLPFTETEFLKLFAEYNSAIWPAQIIAYLLGIAVVVSILLRWKHAGVLASAVLGSMWIWMGAVYNLPFFARINPAAYGFAVLMIIGGLVFLYVGVVKRRISFNPGTNPSSLFGYAFILYAMVVYPLIGMLIGHGYPQAPMFGVAPCPTTLFTFGLLLLARRPVPVSVAIVPVLWSLIGSMAAFKLGIAEDLALLTGPVVFVAILLQNRVEKRQLSQKVE